MKYQWLSYSNLIPHKYCKVKKLFLKYVIYVTICSNFRPLVKDCPKTSFCAKPYAQVTTIRILSCEGLEKAKENASKSYYVIKAWIINGINGLVSNIITIHLYMQ